MKNLHGIQPSPKKSQIKEFTSNQEHSHPIKIVDQQQIVGQVQINNLKFLSQLFSQTDQKTSHDILKDSLKRNTENCILNLSSYKKSHTQQTSSKIPTKKGETYNSSCLDIAQKQQILNSTFRPQVDKKDKVSLHFRKLIQKPSQESLLQTSKRISQIFQSITNQTVNDEILQQSKIRGNSQTFDSRVLVSPEKSNEKKINHCSERKSHKAGKVYGWLNMDVKQRSKKWIENRQTNIQKLMLDLSKREKSNCPFKPTFFSQNSSTQLSIQRMQSSVFSKKLSTKMATPLTEQLMISSIKREDNSQNVRTSKTSVNQYANSSNESKINDSFYRSIKLASNSYKALNLVRRIQNQNDGYLGCKSLINIGKANIF